MADGCKNKNDVNVVSLHLLYMYTIIQVNTIFTQRVIGIFVRRDSGSSHRAGAHHARPHARTREHAQPGTCALTHTKAQAHTQPAPAIEL